MAQLQHRIFAFFMAGLFLFSACAFSAFVVYDMVKSKKDAKASTSTSQQATGQSSANRLQGTQLADFTPTDSIPKLQEKDTKVGDGTEVKAGDTVTVDYTGAIASTGVIFESSKDSGQPVPLSLDQVIQGWKDGIPGMKVGGTRRLLIPSAQAYGAQGACAKQNAQDAAKCDQYNIPPDANLVFDVTLVKIGK